MKNQPRLSPENPKRNPSPRLKNLSKLMLVSSIVAEIPVALPPKTISQYAWYDDDSTVKVYIELGKAGLEGVIAENITSTFNPRELHIVVKDTKGSNHQLRLPNLKQDIVPEKCTHRLRPTKILITLHKVESDKTWYDLLEKK
eukprot:TRINITY_DN3439_c0_g1_i1.p1 TRINITY_DN3439_c0_g1~~TRINITY_DN3439_c0_g1_i1.p1  ORF type:complete len:156 (-),score=27.96 TRINITY_DN3439_c0_g1_i1:40-468(-)